MKPTLTVEEQRLRQSEDRQAHWKRWGPYLSERAWGTVREDYSANGTAWEYFPHNDARSRAYRWNEDGIAGICDRHQYICFALAMWNGRDPILKERLFGLTGNQGNHGEDVKEYYFYLDSTPTHSYMKYLYKYPQAEYPYEKLVTENGRRTKLDPEFELIDSGVFAESRYFDVFVEYAKQTSEDILIEITVANRGSEEAQLTLLPTLWFRNEWSWDPSIAKPSMKKIGSKKNQASIISAKHGYYRERYLYCQGSPELLFTDNETNCERLFNAPSACAFVKDAFHEYVVNSNKAAVNPAQTGTKAAALYELKVPAQSSAAVRLRLSDVAPSMMGDPFNGDFEKAFKSRKKEADDFYATVIPKELSDDAKNVMRQSLAGMLWS
ncbi:MAG: uncharacterized protein JWO20_2627 [Candidatus Angelobacter sp.]|nr:uncharacterized protein [Candidatus Angelobacter sp.]